MEVNNLSLLRCPYCESPFTLNSNHKNYDNQNRLWGIVRCNCDSYPVVANILYLKKDTGMTNKKAVKFIAKKNLFQTIFLLVEDNRIIKSLLIFLLTSNLNLKKYEMVIYQLLGIFSNHKVWINYLKNRNLKAKDFKKWLPLLKKNFKEGNLIVDAGCGNSFIYQNLPKGTQYIGIDVDFLSLVMFQIFHKQYKNSVFICSDLNQGFPIKEAAANHVVFLDSLICMYSKKRILKNSYKVLSKGWLYLFGLFSSNQLTDQWGYGVDRGLLLDYISEYSNSSVSIDSDSLKILKRNDSSTYYSIFVKKN